jgi:lactate dehydrogenase-like 2-hydroxyacid dehydrogenase
MTLSKSIAYHDQMLQEDLKGNWRPAHNPFGKRLGVCTFGVVGAGRIGTAGGNIIDVSHHRLFASPSVQAAQLEVMFEARDPAHGAEIVRSLEQVYTIRRI